MNNFTPNPNEMKREIVNFCKFLIKDVNKRQKRYITEMMYGMAVSKSCNFSEIGRALKEGTKLAYTIDRLSDNSLIFNEEDKRAIMNQYRSRIVQYISQNDPVVILDDSDIAKRYSMKLEDLDTVVDASSKSKELVPGYHVCEAVILGGVERQPISIYSQIYSCKSDNFESMKKYTLDSIEASRKAIGKKCTFIADRGYDDKKLYKYISDNGDYFVFRLDDRNLLFKGKSKNIKEVAKSRKGKVKMDLWFEGEKKHCYISNTRVQLTKNGKEFTFIVVYGLSEEHPLMLLTNRPVDNPHDLRVAVRLYFSRWRIEEYFEAKKQEYKFEKYLVRTLESMNMINMILTMLMGYLGMIAEGINDKLLGIKLIYASQSLKDSVIVWLRQLARGLGSTLIVAKTGIKELIFKDRHRPRLAEQLEFSI